MTITEIYDLLPLTERTMMKRRSTYPFTIANDIGYASTWRVIFAGVELGIVVYCRGRKLCCHGLKSKKE